MAMDRSSRPMHRGRKKVCSFCVDRIDRIDYKDLPRLRKYVSERSNSPPRHRHLRFPSARADRCYQACSPYGSYAVRQRLILTAAE